MGKNESYDTVMCPKCKCHKFTVVRLCWNFIHKCVNCGHVLKGDDYKNIDRGIWP